MCSTCLKFKQNKLYPYQVIAVASQTTSQLYPLFHEAAARAVDSTKQIQRPGFQTDLIVEMKYRIWYKNYCAESH